MSWGSRARTSFARIALVAALAGLFGGVFAAAPAVAAPEDEGQLTITKTVQDDTLGPGDTLVYTIAAECLSFDCVNARLVDSLPPEFDELTLNSSVIVTPPPGGSSTYSWAGRTLTVDFAHEEGAGIAAGDGFSVQVRLSVPSGLSPDWEWNGHAVTNTATLSADNAVTVSDSAEATVTVPYVLSTAANATWSPPTTQFKIGEPSTLTLTSRNTSNAKAEWLQLDLPTDPAASTNLFDTVDFTGFGAMTLPAGTGVQVRVNALVGGTWYDGEFGDTPQLPAGVDAGDVTGLQIVFGSTDAGAAPLTANGSAGSIVVNLAQREDTRADAEELLHGASVTAHVRGTVSVPGQGTRTRNASDTYEIGGLDSVVTGTLAFSDSTIAAGTSTGVTITGRNGSNGPLQSLTVGQPSGFLSDDIRFAGFRSSGAAWPSGADRAVITWSAVDGGGDPVAVPSVVLDTPGAPFPDPSLDDGERITGFSIEFTGEIVVGSTAAVPFTIAVANDAVPAIPGTGTFDDVARIDGFNDAGDADPALPARTLTVLYPQIDVAITKSISPSAAVPSGGRSIVQLRGSTTGDSGYVSPTEIVLTDMLTADSGDYWDAFDAVAVAPTEVLAGSTLEVYSTTNGSDWTPVGSLTAGGTGQYFQTNLSDPDIIGLQFRFRDDDGFAQSTTVQANIAFVARSTLRGEATPTASGATASPYLNSARIDASGDVQLPEGGDVTDFATTTASASVKDIAGSGGTGLMFAKDWTSTGTVNSQSGERKTVRLGWGTEISGYDEAIVSDPADPTQSVSTTVFQAFDLYRIQPISGSSGDSLMKYDQVTDVELYYAVGGWTSIHADACSPASRCLGRFDGYTLSSAQRRDALGVRITFAEYEDARSGDALAPPVGSGVASGPDTRRIDLQFEIRAQLRDATATPADPWVRGDRPYNATDDGLVSNTALLRLETDGGPTATGTRDDAILIQDPTANLTFTKSAFVENPFTGVDEALDSPITIPYPGDVAIADYPEVTFRLTAKNSSAARAWYLRITDQMPCTAASDCAHASADGVGGWTVNPYQDEIWDPTTNPFEHFTIQDIGYSLSGSSGIDTGDSTVTLWMENGSSDTIPLLEAVALGPEDLVDVVGVSALFASDSPDAGGGRIASGATATLTLEARMREFLRSDPETRVGPTPVVNSAFAQIWDGVLDPPDGAEYPAAYAARPVTMTLEDAFLAVDSDKSFSPTSVLERDRDDDVTVTLTADQGASTASPDEVVVQDTDADFWDAFELRSFTSATMPDGADRARVDVQLDGSSTWTPGAESAINPGLPSGIDESAVTGLRVVFFRDDDALFSVTAPAASWNTTIRFVVGVRDSTRATGDPIGFPSTVVDTVTATAEHPGLGIETDSTDRSILLDPGTFEVDLEKRVPSHQKETPAGVTIDFSLIVTNSGTGFLDDPVVVDQLPTDTGLVAGGPLLFDPTSEVLFSTSPGGILPTTGVTMDYDDAARRLTFSWPDGSRLAPGEVYTIVVPLQVAPGLEAEYGDAVNEMTFTSDRELDACTNDSGNGEGHESVGIHGCRTWNDVRTISASAISSFKGVKGDVDTDGVSTRGAVNVSNADRECVADAQGFYRNPCAANSLIGGTDLWKLQFTNGGNIDASEATIVDVLPRPGDKYLGTGASRGSDFRPVFAGGLTMLTDTTGPGGSAGSTFTWQVSTVANPCPAFRTTAGGDPDCDSTANWQDGESFPEASYGSVTAIRVQFDLPGGVMDPATTLAVTYRTVNTPTTSAGDQRAPVSVPLGTPRAWNSFGVHAVFSDGERAVEPVRAGVQLASGPIQVAKAITGASAAYAPTSFAATASCEIAGAAVVLPSSGALTMMASAATPYTARIDGIPLGATCEIVETTTGASATTYSPAGGSGAVLTVAQTASSGDAVPAAQIAEITNEYGETSLTVAKAVSTTATVGAFGPFDFTVACTVDNGTTTLTVPLDPADAAFTLAESESHTISDLPVTARCVVREADSDGATTIGMKVGSGSTTTVSENGPYTATLGTAAEYVVTVTNTYASGRLSVTKDVTGATQYGDAEFEVAVECTYDGQTLFDGSFTLEDGGTELLSPHFPVGTSCAVAETQAGGATVAAADRSVTIVAGTTNTVLTNRFDVGTLRVDKERTGAWERYGAGPFEAQVVCTWDRPGETDLVIPLPDSGRVALTAGNGYSATVTGLIAGAECSVTETKSGAATHHSITLPSPREIPADGESVVEIENLFATGSLRIDKVRDIAAGAEDFAVGPFEVEIECGIDRDGTWYELDLDGAETQTLAAPDYTATVDGILQGASCTVVETDAGLAITHEVSTDSGAVAIPASTSGPAVVTVTNHFLTGELDVEKAVAESLVQGGDVLHYEISVENVGDVEAGGVVVTDEIDGDLDVDASSIDAAGWTCGVTGRDGDGFGGQLECVLDTTLPVGATAPLISYAATLDAEVAKDAVPNTAVVASTTVVVAGDEDTVSTPVKWLDVDATTECVKDAPWLEYSVDARNLDVSGRTMTVEWLNADGDIVHTDEVDIAADGLVTGRLLFPGAAVDADGAGIAWPGWRPALAGETPEWENLVLDPALPSYGMRSGASVRFLINPSTSVAIDYPPATADCAETPDDLPSELWMSKTASTSNLSPGGVFTYTMEIGNTGRGGVTGLVLIDDVPEVLRIIAVTPQAPARAGDPGWVDCVVSDRLPSGFGGTITCELDRDLGAGERTPDVLLEVQLSPQAPGGAVVNTAKVKAWELPRDIAGRSLGDLTTLSLQDSAVVMTTLAVTGASPLLAAQLALALLVLGGILATLRRALPRHRAGRPRP